MAEVLEWLRVAPEPRSLSGSEDADTPRFGEVVSDPSAPKVEEEALSWAVPGEVDKLLSVLDERQRRVVELRFGLDCGHPHTGAEVAGELGLTSHAVTSLQRQAVSRLRRRVGGRGAVLELLAG